MNAEEARHIARQVVLEMTDSVPGIIPQYVSDQIKEKVTSEVLWMQTIPIWGPFSISVEWRFVPNGTIRVTMSDWNGMRFWVAVLRPPMDMGTSLIHKDEKRSYE